MRLTAVQRISGISIHAPREGSDRSHWLTLNITRIISIHAPREGSDADNFSGKVSSLGFLSTLPARGATVTKS